MSADDELAGRTVLVTGGTRGVGLGISHAFASAGADLVVCGRTAPEGDFPFPFVACDVRDPDSVQRLVADVVARTGRIDVVVNNAGGAPYADAATASPRFVERVVGLNLLAPFYVAQAAYRVMAEQPDGGVVINIGSVAAIRPAPGMFAYNAAKAGLAALTRSLAIEWAPRVRVNSVTPGLVNTELAERNYGADPAAVLATVPMRRFAEPSDIAAVCLMLASPRAAYVTGADVLVDGGGEIPAFLVALGSSSGGETDG